MEAWAEIAASSPTELTKNRCGVGQNPTWSAHGHEITIKRPTNRPRTTPYRRLFPPSCPLPHMHTYTFGIMLPGNRDAELSHIEVCPPSLLPAPFVRCFARRAERVWPERTRRCLVRVRAGIEGSVAITQPQYIGSNIYLYTYLVAQYI